MQHEWFLGIPFIPRATRVSRVLAKLEQSSQEQPRNGVS